MKQERHTNIPSSFLVLMRDNDILLLRRANTGFYDGSYSFPAGHVEAGESFTDTLIREAKEEIGILLDPKMVEVKHIIHCKSDADGSERIHAFFTTKEWQGEIENKEPNKCDDLSWFSMDNLPENTIPYIKQAIECIRKGVFYSEFGW